MTQTNPPANPEFPTAMPAAPEEVSLGDFIANIWEGRYIIIAATLLAMMIGGFYAWFTTPVFQVDAMLQVEDRKSGKSSKEFDALASLLNQPTVAEAEIEIIKSNLVLGRTVESLGLDIVATPTRRFLSRTPGVAARKFGPSLSVSLFELPATLQGRPFQIILNKDGSFRWQAPDGSPLGMGRPGETLTASWEDEVMTLQVAKIQGNPGQKFIVTRQPYLTAIMNLRNSLLVSEKGRQTNILGLSLITPSPVRGAEILNNVISQYVRQNIERRAEEASKTLAFLHEQLPLLRSRLETAENQLNQYRMQIGSVDLSEEAKLALKQSVDLESQILTLKQKKEELLRIHQEKGDVISTLNQQIEELSAEGKQIDGRVRLLPKTQQEQLRLMREVQVNADMYTSLRNSAQQLQVTKAGEIGNARIVDNAIPSLHPIKPRRMIVMTLSTFLGLFLGVGATLVRRSLRQNIEDPRLIEQHLGLPVIVTIPHSEQQVSLARTLSGRGPDPQILAESQPNDLAVESLRSLRTSLHFTMFDAKNKVILLSGPAPSAGKTFVASNFGAVLGQSGKRVLIIDGDLRKGYIHRPFGLSERGTGLSEILSGQANWKDVVHPKVLPGLDLITTGTLPPNPAELLMSHRLGEFLDDVADSYDLILIDAAPVLAVTDPVILASHVGSVFIISRYQCNTLDEIAATLQRFEAGGIKVKGCIFNDVKAIKVGHRYRRYAYHYDYGAK